MSPQPDETNPSHVMKPCRLINRGPLPFFRAQPFTCTMSCWHPLPRCVLLRSSRALREVWEEHACCLISQSRSENMSQRYPKIVSATDKFRSLCLDCSTKEELSLFAPATSWLLCPILSHRSRLLAHSPFNRVLLGPAQCQTLWNVPCQSFSQGRGAGKGHVGGGWIHLQLQLLPDDP